MLLCDCHIDTTEELFAFREDIDDQINQLNAERSAPKVENLLAMERQQSEERS